MRRSRAALAAGLAATAAVGTGACSSGEDEQPGPRVDWIDETLAAVGAVLDEPPAYVEVSATLEHVDVIVRDGNGTAALLYRYDGELEGPIEPRDDPRETFTSDEVSFDPDTIFDALRDELDDPAIVDFALYVDGGGLVRDATVASDSGGVIIVLLGADGQVLGLQAG